MTTPGKYLHLTAALVTIISSGACFAQSAAQCEALAEDSMLEADLNIDTAQWSESRSVDTGQGLAAPAQKTIVLPPHCHLEGTLDPRSGVNGVSYSIRFAMNLPDEWNGRFYFQGGGGLNGIVLEPIGNQFTGDDPALHRGFAVVSTDTGHQSTNVMDASFYADQEAALNFLVLAIPRVTEITKAITERYYASVIDSSYFVGCSNGGREGMLMAQRYPKFFDGIVAVAPAMRMGTSSIASGWAYERLSTPGADPNGPRNSLLSPQQADRVVDGFLESCDSLDGVEDGLVFNRAECSFDPRELICSDAASCLSQSQANAVADALAGPSTAAGVQVHPGFPFDSGMADSGVQAGILRAPAMPGITGPIGASVDSQVVALPYAPPGMGDTVALNHSTFSASGGKLVLAHGVSDPIVSALDTIDFFERMASANGGHQATSNWSRLFLVPGMGHCAGGAHTLDNFDLLSSIVEWVSEDAPPESIEATGTSMPGISRPLCPYPGYASYQGDGDSDLAENLVCAE